MNKMQSLFRKLTVRIFAALTLIMLLWGVLFYFVITAQIHDELDDSLEDYSEQIIGRKLRMEELPQPQDGSNNQFFFTRVPHDYLQKHSAIAYSDSSIYVREKREYEPARVYSIVFKDDTGEMQKLTVFSPTYESDDVVKSILLSTVLLYVVLLISFLLILSIVLRRSLRPLYTLLRWVDSFHLGEENQPLKADTQVREFVKLNQTIVNYAHRVVATYDRQKLFIGNVSHEMQTPIAVCRGRIEALLEQESLSEHDAHELYSIYQTLGQMSTLNKTMLLLMKIENGQFVARQPIHWASLVETVVTELNEVFAYKQISCRVSIDSDFETNSNLELARLLVNNLLKNAYAHNLDVGGQIDVRVSANGIVVANTGIPQALESDLIFTRFYHDVGKKDSTGLGLAMVKAICESQQFNIMYSFSGGLHTFELKPY